MSYQDVKNRQQGIALLGAMVVALILSLLGATLLNLAGQESASAGLANQAAVAQQLADAAGELVVAWFHSPQIIASVPQFSSLREKRNYDREGLPSFFDASGRSQFVGTADRSDDLSSSPSRCDKVALWSEVNDLLKLLGDLLQEQSERSQLHEHIWANADEFQPTSVLGDPTYSGQLNLSWPLTV